jgi:uncharacterized phage-associated protein
MINEVNVDKYLEALRFLLDEHRGANNPHLGKVKLMKLLYYADFDHYFRHGASITGDTYVKLEYGPVPRHGQHMLDKLQERKLLDVGEEPVFDYVRNSYRLRQPLAEIQHLTEDEMQTLADVVGKWKNHTREEIVTASHGDPPWIMADYGEEIPYELVFYRENVAGSRDEEPEVITEVA